MLFNNDQTIGLALLNLIMIMNKDMPFEEIQKSFNPEFLEKYIKYMKYNGRNKSDLYKFAPNVFDPDEDESTFEETNPLAINEIGDDCEMYNGDILVIDKDQNWVVAICSETFI